MKAAALALAALLAASPALAGTNVTIGCGDWSEDFLIGSGKQLHGQGLELWPMMCVETGKFATYPRVLDKGRFGRLEKLADNKQLKDGARVEDFLNLKQEMGEDFPELFGRVEELTFGDVRSTVGNTARETAEMVRGSRFPVYSHPTCAKLIPYDFFTDTGTPPPSCQGQPLKILRTGPATWD